LVEPLPATESHTSTMTLSGFPSWQSISMPSLAIPGLASRQASALLGVDLGRVAPSRHISEIEDKMTSVRDVDDSKSPTRVRFRNASHPRSSVHIYEDILAYDTVTSEGLASAPLDMATRTESQQTVEGSFVMDLASDGDSETQLRWAAQSNPSIAALSEAEAATSAEDEAGSLASRSPLGSSPPASTAYVGGPRSSPTTPQRKEDTMRRHKRFSMPAMALQTTPVTAKPATGDGKKRFSLMLGRAEHGPRAATHSGGDTKPTDGKRVSTTGPAISSLQRILSRVKD
jgi:FYVE/RhoGEF/PH domain-containing protein 5/6